METRQIDLQLKTTVSELSMASAALDDLLSGKPYPGKKKLEIIGRINYAIETVPQMTQMVADIRPDPSVIGNQLKDVFELTNDILRKMMVLKKFETTYMTG